MGKVWKIILLLLGVSSFCLLLSFVNMKEKTLACKGVKIHIQRNSAWNFVDEATIKSTLPTGIINNKALLLSSVNTHALENDILKNLPAVESAEIYTTLGGYLVIDCIQKSPLLRIINNKGQSFYIATTGLLIPVLPGTAARVPVCSGNITAGYREGAAVTDSVYKNTLLPAAYKIAGFIEGDSLWSAQVQQLYVNENREFVVVPRVGNFTIVLGDSTRLETKFNKLKLLFNKGFKNEDWNSYTKIDLRYSNQIVCTRKKY